MKESGETANLFLNNDRCLVGANRADSTYRINFRELLGDMYFKYDKFKLVLNYYSAYTAAWALSAGYEFRGTLRLIGLPWYNSSYGTVTMSTLSFGNGVNDVPMYGNNAEACYPAAVSIANNGFSASTGLSPNNNGLCFNKPTSEYVDLRVFIREMRANDVSSTINDDQLYASEISFTIYGLTD